MDKETYYMISLVCEILTGQNKYKLIDTENRLLVTRVESSGEWVKWIKEVNCMVIYDNRLMVVITL